MAKILVLGASGVFGSQIARELLRSGCELTLAARNSRRLARSARGLSGSFRTEALDVTDSDACLKAAEGHSIVVHAAGGFSGRGMEVAAACLRQGCHYVDIADDRDYLRRLRALDGDFSRKGLTAVYGCSSLPGISGALAWRLRKKRDRAPRAIRVLLFIGNRNPKGVGAMDSVCKILGEKISGHPAGRIGMAKSEWVRLPEPFGRKLALNFDSPEYDLFPAQFQCRHVEVQVAFEWNLANRAFDCLSRAPRSIRVPFFGAVRRIANAFSHFGSSGGAVQVEFSYAGGSAISAACLAREKGQRLAIWPALLALQALRSGERRAGVQTVDKFLGPEKLLLGLAEVSSLVEFLPEPPIAKP